MGCGQGCKILILWGRGGGVTELPKKGLEQFPYLSKGLAKTRNEEGG